MRPSFGLVLSSLLLACGGPRSVQTAAGRVDRGTPVHLARAACPPSRGDELHRIAEGLALLNGSDDARTESWPCVRGAGDVFALDLRADSSETSSWGWVAATELADGTIVGVLDSRVEAPAWELDVVVSHDRGRSWSLRGRARKPHYMATLAALEVVSDRRWRLTLDLDDCAGCGVAPGSYVLETRDAGARWTTASRER